MTSKTKLTPDGFNEAVACGYTQEIYGHVEALEAEIERLRPAAESWESYVAAQERKDSPVETASPQAPIARINVFNDRIAEAKLYAPGLPEGEHDLFCVPDAVAPCMRDETNDLREAALQDLAYCNGAQQAIVIAHQSLRAADIWFTDLWSRSMEARAALKAAVRIPISDEDACDDCDRSAKPIVCRGECVSGAQKTAGQRAYEAFDAALDEAEAEIASIAASAPCQPFDLPPGEHDWHHGQCGRCGDVQRSDPRPAALGFGIPNLMADVRQLIASGVSLDGAIQQIATRRELRSEAICALRDAMNGEG